jgi:hypothetical protein
VPLHSVDWQDLILVKHVRPLHVEGLVFPTEWDAKISRRQQMLLDASGAAAVSASKQQNRSARNWPSSNDLTRLTTVT